METPWVSTGIWWVSSFRVWFALGFLRVSAWPPWVSTGIRSLRLGCFCFCYGFPQACVCVASASRLGFHRFPGHQLMIILYASLLFASYHAWLSIAMP